MDDTGSGRKLALRDSPCDVSLPQDESRGRKRASLLMSDSIANASPPHPVERVFILRSRLGRNIYVIRGNVLQITWRLLGVHGETEIPIRSVSSEYEVQGARPLRTVTVLLLPVALCIVAYRFLLSHPNLPDFLLQYPIIIGAAYALAAIKFYPRFEWFVFKNHFGRPVFTILREPNQRAECEEFIHALLDRLETDEPGVPMPASSPAENHLAESSDDVSRWKLAVGLSLFAIVIPPTAHLFGEHGDFFTIMPLVVGSGGAIIAAIYSIAQKESGRHWAMLAAIAALFPLFRY